jgi:hypothetical protein
MKKFLITESEKNRILGMHKSAISKELGFLTEQTNNQEDGVYNNDKDYDYKKEGDKYFFKLKTNPVSPKAKALKTQNKYLNWTEATGASKDAIAKLPFLSSLTAFKPYEGDGTEETFDPPVNATASTQNVSTTEPVIPYPWMENGKASFEAMKKSYAADPNFSNFLKQLKNLSPEQVEKIEQDFKQSGVPSNDDQAYYVLRQAIQDGKKLAGSNQTNTETTTPTTAQNTTKPRTGQEIRQDARQGRQDARQDARQGRKDVRQLESELKNLQATYRRLQTKMTPTDKQSYEARINQIQTELGQA